MAYDAAQRAQVKQDKQARYGHEVFAVPALDSYPLTKHKKPDAERVRAAWDYIHVAANAAKLGGAVKTAEARIRAFAHKHFPDMQLEAPVRKSWAQDEVYVWPDEGLWPLTARQQPNEELVQKAWATLHSALWDYRLTDAGMAQAERRIAAFAAAHAMALVPPRRTRQLGM